MVNETASDPLFSTTGVVQEPTRQVAEARAQHGNAEDWLRRGAVRRLHAAVRRGPLHRLLDLQQLGHGRRQDVESARFETLHVGPERR